MYGTIHNEPRSSDEGLEESCEVSPCVNSLQFQAVPKGSDMESPKHVSVSHCFMLQADQRQPIGASAIGRLFSAILFRDDLSVTFQFLQFLLTFS